MSPQAARFRGDGLRKWFVSLLLLMLPVGCGLSCAPPKQANSTHIPEKAGVQLKDRISVAFVDYTKSPTHDGYRKLVDAIVSWNEYDPYTDEIGTIDSLIEAEKYEEARQRISKVLPSMIVSPGLHLRASYVFGKLGDITSSEAEKKVGFRLLDEVFNYGKGTKQDPYEVLWVFDEEMVLSVLHKQMKSQGLITAGKQSLDQIICDDGSEVWFDVTKPMDRLRERLSGNK